MARFRRRRYGGGGSGSAVAQRGLTEIVGFGLLLYVLALVLNAIWPTVNSSTWFGAALTLLNAIIPITGLIGGYIIVKRTIKAMNANK